MTPHSPHIVDISGLADILLCSKSMVLKTWRSYPHFFIGYGNDARGARFDVNDVIGHLKNASVEQKRQDLDREYPESGSNKGQSNETN